MKKTKNKKNKTLLIIAIILLSFLILFSFYYFGKSFKNWYLDKHNPAVKQLQQQKERGEDGLNDGEPKRIKESGKDKGSATTDGNSEGEKNASPQENKQEPKNLDAKNAPYHNEQFRIPEEEYDQKN